MLPRGGSYYRHSNLDKKGGAIADCRLQVGDSGVDSFEKMSDFLRPPRDEPFSPPSALQLRAVTRACFADEIAIDFPALGTAIDRVCDTFTNQEEHLAAASASVTLTPRQAFDGTVVPLEVALPGLCGHCGGRGESWSDPCDSCCGTGECDHPHHVHLAVPARVADGTRFRFVLSSPRARPTRVEVTVSVA